MSMNKQWSLGGLELEMIPIRDPAGNWTTAPGMRVPGGVFALTRSLNRKGDQWTLTHLLSGGCLIDATDGERLLWAGGELNSDVWSLE